MKRSLKLATSLLAIFFLSHILTLSIVAQESATTITPELDNTLTTTEPDTTATPEDTTLTNTELDTTTTLKPDTSEANATATPEDTTLITTETDTTTTPEPDTSEDTNLTTTETDITATPEDTTQSDTTATSEPVTSESSVTANPEDTTLTTPETDTSESNATTTSEPDILESNTTIAPELDNAQVSLEPGVTTTSEIDNAESGCAEGSTRNSCLIDKITAAISKIPEGIDRIRKKGQERDEKVAKLQNELSNTLNMINQTSSSPLPSEEQEALPPSDVERLYRNQEAIRRLLYRRDELKRTQCDAECGQKGLITINYECFQDKDNKKVDGNRCVDPMVEYKVCDGYCPVYAWARTALDKVCNAQCGEPGIIRYKVFCQNDREEPAAESFCTAQRLASAEACTGDCFAWVKGTGSNAWEACSNSCGAGTQSEKLICMRNGKDEVRDSRCGPRIAVNSRSCVGNRCTQAQKDKILIDFMKESNEGLRSLVPEGE